VENKSIAETESIAKQRLKRPVSSDWRFGEVVKKRARIQILNEEYDSFAGAKVLTSIDPEMFVSLKLVSILRLFMKMPEVLVLLFLVFDLFLVSDFVYDYYLQKNIDEVKNHEDRYVFDIVCLMKCDLAFILRIPTFLMMKICLSMRLENVPIMTRRIPTVCFFGCFV
jgi:hypothetical protein